MQKLNENHATILTLRLFRPNPLKKWGHYVVAYKTMGQVFYFDPQKKIHSTNPGDLAQTNTVTRFGMFHVKGVTTPMPLKTTTCPIEFVGGKLTRRNKSLILSL